MTSIPDRWFQRVSPEIHREYRTLSARVDALPGIIQNDMWVTREDYESWCLVAKQTVRDLQSLVEHTMKYVEQEIQRESDCEPPF